MLTNSQGIQQIKAIHVYDFDNTLFKTPLPNPQIWNGPTIGQLSNPDVFTNGGWWHDSRILAATGEGLEKEEPKAWEGWWNEKIVELVRLSEEQSDALTVLLTGRSESGFSELIKRMVAAKKLDFDLISLKPAVGPNNERFASTMHFKQQFLKAIMETYKQAEEIRIYEDRVRHVKGFRDFLADYNKVQHGPGARIRAPISAEVIMVPDQATTLDPVAEVAEVQHLVNEHNEHVTNKNAPGQRLTIKKTVFLTGYSISPADSQRLLSLAQIPAALKNDELKYHANNIMITPKACPPHILKKVGGMGAKMTWEVKGVACLDNSIWAASVQPVPPTAKYHSDNPVPLVVLALKRGAKPIDATRIQDWQPVPPDKAFVFETVVREKLLLRIEAENPSETPYESLFVNKTSKRKFDDGYGRGGYGGPGADGKRQYHTARGGGGQGQFRGGRGGGGGGGRGNFRGGRGGAPKGPRGGRGGGHHYKSLDDAVARENQGGFKQQMSYEDPAALPQQQQSPQVPLGPAAYYNQQSKPQHQAPYQQEQQQYGGWQVPQQGGPPPQGQQGRPTGGGGYGAGGADLQSYY